MSCRIIHRVVWSISALLLLAVWGEPALGQAQQRKLGTIGPPPRQSPQRQTSGESVPPLPLPAAPMRRSEPKAEPAPPLFIGKLAYGLTQDYMPNPGDVDNLLRHVRQQLDAWYGYQIISLEEIVGLHQQGKTCQVPMLYITGYEPFEFTEPQREALREFLLDGGTLVGDATLGSQAFADSFRSEVRRLFPDRKFDQLQPDHPLLRSYYQARTVEYFTIAKGTPSKIASLPVFEGMNLAARTAIILSPYDLTCGWDEFYAPPPESKVPNAPRSMAMMPADALRMGINVVAYVAAQRRFGQAQASTRQIIGDQTSRRAGLPIAHLRHQGDWNADPNSLYQFIRLAAQRTSVPVEYELRPVDAQVEQLTDTPFVIMTGMDDPGLSDAQVAALRRHLQAGGFLFINNTSGYALFDREARRLVERILPDRKLDPVPADHPLLDGLYKVQEAADASTGQARPSELEAVFVDGRALIVYSKNDCLAMLKGIHDPYANAYDAQTARKMSLNVLTYALRR